MRSLLLVLLIAPGQAVRAESTATQVGRLIRQLGSDRFAEREAASKGLAALGEAALDAVRAARQSPDLEVRRRANRLVRVIERKRRQGQVAAIKRQVEDLKTRKLSPPEKGRRLQKLIPRGTTWEEVVAILGKPSSSAGKLGIVRAHYESYDVEIVFACFQDSCLRVLRVTLKSP